MEAEDIMTTRIKLRRDTTANWISANPILSAGEPGLETDTRKIKYGDGATAWRELAYANSKIEGRTPIEVNTQDPSSWVNVVGRPRNQSCVNAVVYDTKGNVIALSYNDNGTVQSENDSFSTVTKFDAEGNVLWQTDILGYYPEGYGLDTDSQDNVYLSFTKRDGPAWVSVVKLNSNGVQQWAEYFTHFYDCAAFLVVDRNDNPVVNGFSSHPGSSGGYVLRLNKTTGDVITNVRVTDDTNGEEITNQGMAIDADNNVILVGSHYNGDNSVLIVQKISGINFEPIWTKKIDTIDGNDMNGGGVACDGANNIYITGSFYSYQNWNNLYKAVVLKLDTGGVVQWSRDIKGECYQGGTAIVVGPNDGNLYLTSVSYQAIYRDNVQEHQSKQVVALACYESSTGKVLWQNYIGQNQLSEMSPGNNVNTNFDYNRGQAIDMQGDHIVVGGCFVPHANNGYGSSSDDWGMQTGWLMQFPSNGDNVDIGGWKLSTSRIPGRFQSFQTTGHDIAYDTDVFDWGMDNEINITGESNISVVRIAQDSNTWTFDLKGDLNLPANGDLTLAKKDIGWVNFQGFKNNYSDNVYFQGVCVDPDDNSYAFGRDDNYGKPYVVKYSSTGEVLWQMNIDTDFDGDVYGYAESAAWDKTNNQLVVVSTNTNPDYNQTLVTRLDPQTGKVVSNTTLDMGETGINVYDVQVNSSGVPVVVGQTYGGFKGYTVTVNAGTSGVDYLDVLASNFTDGNLPVYGDPNWLISGTGIDGVQYVDSTTNRYDPVTATVAVGTGAQFDVTVVSTVYSVVVTSGHAGSGYKVGDKLLISAANVGGGNSSNDLLLNVETVDGSAILTVSVVSGVSAGADAVYTAQGAAPVPGTGATFWVDKYLDGSTPVYETGYNVGGSGYKANDVLTISGTQLGGTAITNDISLTITGVDIFGAITGYSVTGTPTPDMSTIRLHANLPSSVNFAQAGTWQVGYYTGTDGFVWTPTWQKLYGLSNDRSADGEYFTSVAIDLNDDIVIGMEAYDSNFYGGGDPIAVVAKLNGDNGTIQWQRCFDYEGAPQSSPLVACDSEGNVVISVDDWNTSRVIWKCDPDGTILWKVATDSEEVFYKYSGTVAIDADDNIIVTGGDDYGDWAIDKIDPSGAVLFNRRLKLGYDMYQQEGDDGTRWTAVQGDHIWTAGTTYAFGDDYYNGFVAKLPLDGSGTNGSTLFDYTDEQIPYGLTTNPYWASDYNGLEIHATSGITATESTPSVHPIITWPEDYYKSYTFPITEPTAGGIVFADGSRQDTSASDLPQRLITGGSSDWQAAYKLQLTDRGRHLLLTDNRHVWLGDYNQVQFPIGSVITLINVSGGYRRVYFNGDMNWMGISGTDTTSYSYYQIYLEIPPYDGGNVVTLIKIGGEPEDFDDNAPPGLVYSSWIASGSNLNITD